MEEVERRTERLHQLHQLEEMAKQAQIEREFQEEERRLKYQQQKREAVRPEKKELLDPDETADVAYGSGAKKGSPAAGKKTGTDALKINVNTGGTQGGGTGGLNV